MNTPKPRPRGRPVQTQAQYRKIADDLRRRLIAGQWPPGVPLPSQRQLAQEYQVGLDVIRAATQTLQDEDRIGRTGDGRLTAVPLMAVLPDMSTQHLILLVYSIPFNKILIQTDPRELHLGLASALGKLQLPFIVCHSYTLSSAPAKGFLNWPLKGIVLYGPHDAKVLSAYERLPCPVVLTDQPAFKRKLHSVSVDNITAAREATERLIALGHRRIAFIRIAWTTVRDIDPDSKERQAGFEAAMRAADLRTGEVFTTFSGDGADRGPFHAVAQPSRGFTAALCVDPGRARLLQHSLQNKKRRVPEDFSIVCFQGKGEVAEYSGPCIDFYQLGQRVAEVVLEPRRPPRHVLVTPQWRDANSTGPAPDVRKK